MGDVLLVLAFSGGGTRAAALSYGVLQELRDTRVVVRGVERRLLDEVDLITSVSGGSFTSAYYALYGDRIFADYEPRFLRRNIQRRLLLELVRPRHWIRLASTFFDRSELAVQLYDDEIFDRATFADLQAAQGPFVQINAADLAGGNRFTFFQPQFDLICSDLSQLKVARAVAASSAVPGLFTPITLRSYAGQCGFKPPAWFGEAGREQPGSLRRLRNAEVVQGYLDGKRQYIHLVDGGIADNLGLRGPLDNVILVGGLRQRFDQLGGVRPAHIMVVVVNAEVHREPALSRTPAAPSLSRMLSAVSGVQISSYNFETLELLRASLKTWADEIPPEAHGRTAEQRRQEDNRNDTKSSHNPWPVGADRRACHRHRGYGASWQDGQRRNHQHAL
jgi:NTE family protein